MVPVSVEVSTWSGEAIPLFMYLSAASWPIAACPPASRDASWRNVICAVLASARASVSWICSPS